MPPRLPFCYDRARRGAELTTAHVAHRGTAAPQHHLQNERHLGLQNEQLRESCNAVRSLGYVTSRPRHLHVSVQGTQSLRHHEKNAKVI